HFFDAFKDKILLPLAVQKASKQLHNLEGDFPCASWLPTLVKDTNAELLTWEMLVGKETIIDILIMGFYGLKLKIMRRKYWFLILAVITILIAWGIHNITYPSLKDACALTTIQEISCGEISIFDNSPSGDKKLGLDYFKKQQYDEAEKYFKKAFEQNSQDYETGIFRENSKVLKEETKGIQIFPVSVVIPTVDKSEKITYSASKATIQGIYNQQKKFNDDNNKNKLLIVIANDNNDTGPENQNGQAQNVAKELITRKIYAIIGPFSSKVAYYTKHFYTNKQIVVMSYANTGTSTTYNDTKTGKYITHDLTKDSPFYFRVSTTNKQQAHILADHFERNKYDNLILFYQDEDIFSGSFGQEFKKYWTSTDQEKNFNLDGKNKITDERYLGNITEPTIDEILKNAKKQNLGIVLCPGSYTQVNNRTNKEKTDFSNSRYILKNYTEQILIGSCNVIHGDEDTIKQAKNLKNIVVTGSWFYAPNNINDQFKKGQEIWKKEKVNYHTESFISIALAQDAVMIITEALSKVNKPSGSELQQYLADPGHKFYGITGEIFFTKSDRNLDTSVLITPKCETKECNKWGGEWEIVK
ncbi:MAG TPA: ABC transporter substrate-binding protein, partial [Allocoleopsis sp.]